MIFYNVRIEKLKINNFKSYYGELELNFEKDIKGMWKIVGPVGSGKTTIGEAIIYGLFGGVKNKNNDSLISWGEKHALVELWCVSKGKSIYIKREINSYGQSPTYVEVDGEELVYTDKRDIQYQLENDYYDVSRTTVELLCIISFGNFKSISSLSTQDARKFLDNVLGFAALTQYVDVSKTLRAENAAYIARIQSVINQCNAQIDKINELTNKEIIRGNVKIIKSNIDNLNEDLSKRKEEYEKSVRDARKVIEDSSAELASVKVLGVNKAKEIEFIKKGTCPTCGAPIDQSMLPTKEKELDILRKQYMSVSEKLNGEKLVPGNLKDEYMKVIAPLKEQLEENKAKLIRLQEQTKRSKVNEGEIDKIQKILDGHNEELSNAQFEDQQWNLLIDLLSTEIRSEILEAFIPVLNENIMKYTQRLRQPYLISFNNQFKCQIKLLGLDEEISINSLSTGQLKTVDMIVILSILGTVMGGNSLNVIFLDELFNNMHRELREEMCWLLRENMKEGDTIFTISHYEINEGFFDGTMTLHLEQIGQYKQQTHVEIQNNK